MKRARRWFIRVITALAVLAGVAALWVYWRLNQDSLTLDRVAGELVFMSDRDGDWDIYLLDTAGELHNLTAASSAHEYYPSFTFDGEQISLFSATRDGVTPARIHVDGTGFETQDVLSAMLTVLAEGQTDWDPVWNPCAGYLRHPGQFEALRSHGGGCQRPRFDIFLAQCPHRH